MLRTLHCGPEGCREGAAPPGAGGWHWIDLTDPTDEEVSALAARYGFDPLSVEDVLQTSEYPKLEEFADHLFVVSHTPSVRDDRLRMVEVDSFLTADTLVTIHAEPLPGIDQLWERCLEVPGVAPSPDVMLARLLEMWGRRILVLVDGLDEEAERLEELAIAGDPAVVGLLQPLRRDAIVLRRVVAPQRDVVGGLARSEERPLLGAGAMRRLTAVHADHFRIVESLDGARALLAAILDTYRSTVAERMNEVMKVLTVFSAIILPLSLLAGVYGMNFANMPELEWRWAYFVLLGIMAAAATALWVYFARRGFIGGPRVPRVDRVIGRGLGGLVHLTLMPVQAVIRVAEAGVRTLEGEPDDPEG